MANSTAVEEPIVARMHRVQYKRVRTVVEVAVAEVATGPAAKKLGSNNGLTFDDAPDGLVFDDLPVDATEEQLRAKLGIALGDASALEKLEWEDFDDGMFDADYYPDPDGFVAEDTEGYTAADLT